MSNPLARLVRRLPRPGDPNLVLGVARIGARSAVRTASRVRRLSIDTAGEIAREIRAGAPVTTIVDERVETVRAVALRALGLADPARAFDPAARQPHQPSATEVRAFGDHLLALSTEPADPQPHARHPAYLRILQELTPDEARILRFMALAGPQPSVDVRTRTPFGVGSERIAGGLNLVADMAGCRYPELNQQYLANLNRLGMIRFSAEQVDDPRRYSFIEAQPACTEAMARVRKAVTVYRSIYLSLFGQQFCEQCFTLDGYDAGGWIRDVR